ncbi:MAG: GGDEF domain-containing protein [Methyloversatilis sp.]|jgi:diguanylate cyclase (GGDEF)-like protein|nr:GGDEF domain-containing protein [Methyloversatilis sp.]
MDKKKDCPEPQRDAPPPVRAPARWLSLVLNDEPRQRLRISRAFTSMLVYVVCLGLAEYALAHEMADPIATRLLQSGMIVWMVVVYATLRSGVNLRFRDPSLTFLQIMAAGAWITAAYIVFAPVRGALLMLLALTLVFSIFNLDRKRRRIYNGCVVVGTGLTMFTLSTLRPDEYPAEVEVVHFLLTTAVLAVMGRLSEQLLAIQARLRTQRNELEAALTRIQELATRDALTGLPNRRHITDLFAQMARGAERTGSPLTVCLLDLDHFKRINDTYGHKAGDTVLKRFADTATGALRDSDVLARWGGEEFLVLLPDTPAKKADQSMARVRAALAQTRLVTDAAAVTFSAGLAQFRPGESIEHAVERADFALYRAKSEGRNRCVISD